LDIGESGGATRQAITKQQLEILSVVVPPMKLQEQFAAFVTQVDKSKVVVQKALDEAQLLFDSLMQKYFG
jgi:type I restriction enzyme S subunit